MTKLFFIAGETSGDSHAAEVIRAIKALAPDTEIHAYGGERMAEAGAMIHYPLPNLASIGLDWIWHYREYRRLAMDVPKLCRNLGIQTLVLVDFPGFNLRVAKLAQQAGMRVLYYIIPQVWAWHASRVEGMKRSLHKSFVIFPFEETFLAKRGAPAAFVGHPLTDALRHRRPPDEIRAEHGLPSDNNVRLVGLLPGSRPREVERLAPILREAAKRLFAHNPKLHFVVPRAARIPGDVLRQAMGDDFPWTLVENPSRDMRACFHLSITKSGTSTLENAILGVPQIIIYRVSALDAFIFRRFITVKWVGIINILAGREICPEMIQENCTAERIVRAAIPLLEDSPEREAMLRGMAEAVALLGDGNAAQRAAGAILGEAV